MFAHMVRVLNGSMSLDDALGVFLEASAQVLGLESGWIWLLDEQGQYQLAASRALPPGVESTDWASGVCYCQRQYLAGALDEAQHVEVYRCSRLDELGSSQTEGLSFHISVGLDTEDERFGILNLASRHRHVLNEQEMAQLGVVRDVLVMAIERAKRIDAVRQRERWQQREHLSRQVHDTIAQNLSGILMLVDVVSSAQPEGVDPRQAQWLSRIESLARESLEDIRHMVTDWRHHPECLVDLREHLAQWVPTRVRAPMTWTIAWPEALSLDAQVSRGLFRVIQEAVHNTLHHAQATHVHLSAVVIEQTCVVCIEDDGLGFDPNVSTGGLGLAGIRERMALLGGEVFWHSELGQGTVVECRLPLEKI